MDHAEGLTVNLMAVLHGKSSLQQSLQKLKRNPLRSRAHLLQFPTIKILPLFVQFLKNQGSDKKF